jgi:hypothetical protein
MGSNIYIYSRNILETGTTTVTGTADTGYPKPRIYDRASDLFWKYTNTGTIIINIDQGSTSYAVNAFIVENHNFNGYLISVEYSSNDVDYSTAVDSWTQSDDNIIDIDFSSTITARYWRITVTSIENPKCGEIFLTLKNEFKINFSQNPSYVDEISESWIRVANDAKRGVQLGSIMKERSYSIFFHCEAPYDYVSTFDTIVSELQAAAVPIFYFKDHKDNLFLAKFDPTYPRRLHYTEQQELFTITVEQV